MEKYTEAIRRIFCTQNGKLLTPLGNWKRRSDKWSWRYNLDNTILYVREKNEWTAHKLRKRTRKFLWFRQNGEPLQPIGDETPITEMVCEEQQIKTRIPKSILKRSEQLDQVIYFNDYIDTLQQWEAELIRGTQQVLEIEDIIPILQDDQKLYLVSDGGEENGLGYFGWVIASETEILVKHKGHAAGNPSLIESLRTESVGALSIISYILRLCEFYEIQLPRHKTVHYCDNKTAVNRIRASQRWNILYPNMTLKADYDVQAQIDETIKLLKSN